MDKSHDPVFFIWAHQNASQRGEETEMTLLPISRSLPRQPLCFSFGCRDYTNAHIRRGSEHWEAVVRRC